MGKLLRKLRNGQNKRDYEGEMAELDWLDLDDADYEDDIDDADYEDDAYEDEDADYEDDAYEDEDAYYEEDAYEDEDYEDDEDDVDYEDAYYEDADYEDEDEDEEIAPRGIKRLFFKFRNMSTVDHIVMFTGIIVLILAGVTGGLYLSAKSTQKQVETFAEIGQGLDGITMIGESGLVAISDAYASKLMAVEMEEEQEEQGDAYENAEVDGKTAIALNLTSIQKDLKIKFVNKKSGKLIPSIEFEVEIEKPSGGTYSMKDDDKDGIIYQKDMEPGRYIIKIIAPTTHDEFSIPTETQAITVRDKIEYKKVDVADEVKTEAQVNVAVEDTKVNETVVESTNTDTVEWVESTKSLISGTEKTQESYEKVDYDKDITDPSTRSARSFRLLSKRMENIETPTPTADPASDPTPTAAQTAEPTVAPTDVPTAVPTAEPTAAPTAVPSATPSAAPTDKPNDTPTPTSTPAKATPTATPTTTPTSSPAPSVSPTPSKSPTSTPTASPNKAKDDNVTPLKDNAGNILYIRNADGTYREAKYADYYKGKTFYRLNKKVTGEYSYTGWQTIDGRTYFFDKNGNKVTGEQVIQGAKYTFNSDGSLNNSSGQFGIDVSKWNGNIDWNAVKNSGVSYVIIRCGYRGSTTGALIEDPTFRSNIQGASKAGLKVGVYFFTQAMNEVEAVEEASMVLGLVKGYNLSFPIFLDVEASKGRADSINVDTRTAVCKAFCQTIQNSGYKAGIYANKTWFTSYINTSALTGYKIWLAQYAAAPTYTRTRYDIWQYSSKGSVTGISGNVDMNISYMGY